MRKVKALGPTADQTTQWLLQGNHTALASSVSQADVPEDFRKAILEDLRSHAAGDMQPGHSEVKRLVNAMASGHIYGLFHAPYFPSLGLDGLKYEPLPLPEYPSLCFPSPVVPVNIVQATPGFYDRVVVALFPENHIDGIQTSKDKIFYFINKFTERHIARTRPIIQAFTEPGLFDAVEALCDKGIAEASVHWVWLHEHFHREGPAPLPEYLDIKSYRPLAGLEECRVDMEAICRIHDTPNIPRDKVDEICLFILAERLLRYSVEGIPKPNYDAIGSQVLVNFLKRAGHLWIRNGRLGLSSEYILGLEDFVSKIRSIESRLETQHRSNVKKTLLEFVNSHMNMPYESSSYRHDEFFLHIQRELAAPCELDAAVH
jgi:hypothetical protein